MTPALKDHGREQPRSIYGPACTTPEPIERSRRGNAGRKMTAAPDQFAPVPLSVGPAPLALSPTPRYQETGIASIRMTSRVCTNCCCFSVSGSDDDHLRGRTAPDRRERTTLQHRTQDDVSHERARGIEALKCVAQAPPHNVHWSRGRHSRARSRANRTPGCNQRRNARRKAESMPRAPTVNDATVLKLTLFALLERSPPSTAATWTR